MRRNFLCGDPKGRSASSRQDACMDVPASLDMAEPDGGCRIEGVAQ
jgi:hypothetical protein